LSSNKSGVLAFDTSQQLLPLHCCARQGLDHTEGGQRQQCLDLAYARAQTQRDRHQVFVGMRVEQEVVGPALIGKALVVVSRQIGIENLPQLRS
jgi:hypothetical protein